MADNTSEKEERGVLERLVPILLVASIALAFVVGVLWQKVSNLESGNVAGTETESEATVETQQADNPTITIDQIKSLFSQNLIKFGNENSKVLFVEIMDPSCPYCHIASGKNAELNAEAGDKFKLESDGGTYVAPVAEMRKLVDSGEASFVYLYQNGHNAGEMAQKALYCSYDMGKFWEVHDLLMSNKGYNLINNTIKNDKGKSQELVDFLVSVVDSNELKDCIDSGKYDGRLTSDMQLAASLGVNGTPGFFINEVNFAGAYSWTDMKTVVDQYLQ